MRARLPLAILAFAACTPLAAAQTWPGSYALAGAYDDGRPTEVRLTVVRSAAGVLEVARQATVDGADVSWTSARTFRSSGGRVLGAVFRVVQPGGLVGGLEGSAPPPENTFVAYYSRRDGDLRETVLNLTRRGQERWRQIRSRGPGDFVEASLLQALAEEFVRANAGPDEAHPLPPVDSGEEGLRATLLSGGAAAKLAALAAAQNGDLTDFEPAREALIVVRTSEDESDLHLARIDRRSGSARYASELVTVDTPYELTADEFAALVAPTSEVDFEDHYALNDWFERQGEALEIGNRRDPRRKDSALREAALAFVARHPLATLPALGQAPRVFFAVGSVAEALARAAGLSLDARREVLIVASPETDDLLLGRLDVPTGEPRVAAGWEARVASDRGSLDLMTRGATEVSRFLQ